MVVFQARLLEIVGLNLSLAGLVGLGQVQGQNCTGVLGGENKVTKTPEPGIHGGSCAGHGNGDTDRSRGVRKRP